MRSQAGLQSGEHLIPMIWNREALEQALASPVADMVNDSESIGVYSSIGGYFIYAQVCHDSHCWVPNLAPKSQGMLVSASECRHHHARYFAVGQMKDLPAVRWAHIDLGDPVRDRPFGPDGRW